MRRIVWTLPVLALLIAFSTGCATEQLALQRETIARQTHEIDSLGITNRGLYEQIRVLRDSLQFLDDIDSGQYYREQRSLLDRIERLEYDLGVARDGGVTISTIPSDDLFKPGAVDLSDAGKKRLAEVAEQIKTAHKGKRLRVEAFTDNVPVGKNQQQRFPTNWEVSAARATAIARYFIDEAKFDANLVEAVGHGDTNPVAPNNTEAGRRANRRIRIAAMPVAPEKSAAETDRKDAERSDAERKPATPPRRRPASGR